MANALTIGRILLTAPFIAFFLYNAPWGVTAALIVFLIAAATDFLDGRIARARGETSALGAALDPLADKLLVAAALILLLRNGVAYGADAIAVLAIILREILVTGLREAVVLGGGRLPVTSLAKVKTALQLAACALLMAAAPTGPIGPAAEPAARLTLWLAAGVTVWTGGRYAVAATAALRRTAAREPE